MHLIFFYAGDFGDGISLGESNSFSQEVTTEEEGDGDCIAYSRCIEPRGSGDSTGLTPDGWQRQNRKP
jgi:hypothetical protein